MKYTTSEEALKELFDQVPRGKHIGTFRKWGQEFDIILAKNRKDKQFILVNGRGWLGKSLANVTSVILDFIQPEVDWINCN